MGSDDLTITLQDSDGKVLRQESYPPPKHRITVYKCPTCRKVLSGVLIHYMSQPAIHYTLLSGEEITESHQDMVGESIIICGAWKYMGTYIDGEENPYKDTQDKTIEI
jgi:hypothetical protein